MRFKDNVVMVTGAAGGIGTAICTRFADEGARIVALDLVGTDFSSLQSAIKQLDCIEMDVTEPADWQRAITQTVARFGGIDVLVNNAGIPGPLGRLEDCTVEDFDRTQAVNVRGVFLGMQSIIAPMRERGGGVVVNISSVSGERGNPRVLPYVASKHAVHGMTKSAALDLIEYGIRVNAVSPSPTDTNMVRKAEDLLIERTGMNEDDARAAMTANIPMGRYGEPSEIAAAVAFVSSHDASFMTGTVISVDGGILAY